MGRYARREIRPSEAQQSTRPPAAPALAQPERSGLHDLQHTLGNQGVQRLLTANPTLAQAKLTVGAADDAYEQEADRVASEVMSMNSPSSDAGGGVQRAAEEDELGLKRDLVQRESEGPEREDDELGLKRAPEIVQRAALGEDDEMAMKRIQRASDNEGLMGSFDVEGELEGQIATQKGGGQAMDSGDQEFFQSRFGQDFSGVKVHTGGDSDAINRSLGARAFTNGSDVFMRNGEYSPGNSASRELLAHELTHVVQQTGSRPLQPKRDDQPCDGC